MSFKDSILKYTSATANSVQTANVESAEIAVQAADNYISYNNTSRYKRYSQYSDNNYSLVDKNKNINVDPTQINITQESNSQYIPFQIPRYYDGIDLLDMTIKIRYARVSDNKGQVASVINVSYNSENIRFGWLVDSTVTSQAGDIIFEIRATGKVGNLDYEWSTRPNGRLNIIQGLNYNGIIKPDDSWYTSFRAEMQDYVSRAQTAATNAENSANRVDVDKIKSDVKSSVASEVTSSFNQTLKNNYYTSSEIDTQKKAIYDEIKKTNTAMGQIDSLKNLEAEYEDATGNLVLRDKVKNTVLSTTAINGLSKLVVEYTTENGIGTLTFKKKGDSTPITSVNLGSIDPSEEWVKKNVTPISNKVTILENSNSELTNKVEEHTQSITNITSVDTKLREDVDNHTKRISTNENNITSLRSDVDPLKESNQTLVNDVSEAKNNIGIIKQNISGYDEQFNSIGSDITSIRADIDEIKKNPAASEYDVEYEENIFKFIKDGEIQKQFKIEGGGGGGSDTSVITIERITPSDAIFLLSDSAIIEYNFTSVDNTGDATGNGTATWRVGSATVATTTAVQGKNSFDITEYLTVGQNSIRLTITDSFGTLSSKTWTVTIVEFKLESTFDDSLFYVDSDIVFRYTPYGNVNKKVHFILDDKELTAVDTQASGRQMSYAIDKQAHGSHLLKVYMTATINNKDITSNTIYKDIISVDPSDRTPIIGCAMQEFTAKQHHATSLKYVVYDPDHNPATVKLSVNGKLQSTLTVGRTAQIWSYKSSDIGQQDLTISCRKVTKILKANITKLNIDVSPITANLAFDFNPTGLSNGDVNRLWKDTNHPEVALTVSDNFDWDNGGYQIDNEGNQYFCVKAGTHASISYNLFGKDPKQTGAEFKLIFKTKNVRNSAATFLSCISDTDSNAVGLEMNVHEAYIRTSTNNLYFPYSEEDTVEFEYNINTLDTKDSSATSIVMTYEDGVGGRPIIYDNTHRLHQYAPVPISIGSNDCDVHIYRMKAYSASLTDSDILSNFIADARDSDEMISRYNRNQIYNENNALTPDSVANACPDLRIIKIEAPYFTNDKKDFVKDTSMECIYKNGDPVLDNWKFMNCYHAGQGTTSNEYGFAARNIDVIACFDGVHQVNSKIKLDPNYKTELTLGDGSKTTDGTGKVALTRNSVPNNWFNFKVNVASSEMSNNALLQKRYNDYLPYKTPATRRDPKIKNSMEFVNCVIFLKESDPDLTTHREFQDTDWHFYSLGNIGDSKKTDVTRAYDPDDMKEFCIEISDNTLPNSAFQTGVTNPNGTIKYPITKEEWKAGNTAYDNLYNNWDGSFEFRYDCCGDSKDGTSISTDEEKEKIRQNNRQIWRDFYKFVVTSSDKDFVDHLKDWVIVDAALYLYLFTLRYTMIDNRAKNVFPHWAKHYISQEEAATMSDKASYYTIDDSMAAINNGYRFDFWDYDNDTALGINNSGELTMSYGKEDIDYKTDGKPSSGWIFNAAESVLWCRIRDLMTSQLRALYQSVDQNCWSDTHLINEFDAWQNQFPEELWRLHYERLYIRTYKAGTVRFLVEMMNGRKKYQRRQWERDQHAYMGTKFVHTDIKSDQIMFRCNTPKTAVVKPDYTLRIVPYSDMYISVLYGNSADPTQVRAKAGQEYEIKTNLTNMDDTAILIYCASRIQALNDLSACYIHDNDFSKASKLRTLVIGNDTEGYQNSFITTLNMGNNTLLETLNIRNCPNLTGSVNLSACENLINLYAEGTVITSVLLANHGKITHAYLPETINTLTFKNLKDLTDLKVASYKNLETFVCQNSIVDALTIINTAIETLRTISITGISWNLDDTSLLKKLAKLNGIDDNGSTTDKSVLSGSIHVPVMRAQEYKEFVGSEDEPGIWSDLELTYDSMIAQFKVSFVNDDEKHSVLDVQYVDKGSNAVDPIKREEDPIPIPTKESTVEWDYTYKEWDTGLTSIFADRIITAVYSKTVRQYLIKYVSKGTELFRKTAPYGSTVKYEGDTPTYTAEEAAYKFSLFKGWDDSGMVTGNKTINALYDTCEYSDGYYDDKNLNDLSEVELYAMMKMNLENKLSIKDSLTFKLGVDYEYNDVEQNEIISEDTIFDGTNHIDTNLALFKNNQDFTIAIDYEFASGNTVGATLMQCFQSDGSNGFRLWYNNDPRVSWGTSNTNASSGTSREMIVLRYLKGSNKLYIYNSHMSGNSVTTTTLSAIRIPNMDSTLVLGCSKADDGAYENPAKGTVHWCKVWMADLGEEQCKDIASWIHEEIKMELAKFKGYYLSNVSGKRANLTFVASNLLGINKAYTNSGTSSGGWAKSTLNTWLNARLYKAISPLWKALIKPVKVYSSIGNKSINTTASNCYFYIPSIYELDGSYNQEPYSSEVAAGTQGPIPYMTNSSERRKAKSSTLNKYENYLTRSPNVDATQWLYSIDEDGNAYGYTYVTQEQGVLLMFSIGVE